MIGWWTCWHGVQIDPKWSVLGIRVGVPVRIAAAIPRTFLDRASQADDRDSLAGFDAQTLGEFSGPGTNKVDGVIAAMRAKNTLLRDRFAASVRHWLDGHETTPLPNPNGGKVV